MTPLRDLFWIAAAFFAGLSFVWNASRLNDPRWYYCVGFLLALYIRSWLYEQRHPGEVGPGDGLSD